jgi:hypothetical protein
MDGCPPAIMNKRKLQRKKYCVTVEGEVVRETDRFWYAREAYIGACRERHSVDEPIHEKIYIGKNVIKDSVVEDL